jgi:hypothetical protein
VTNELSDSPLRWRSKVSQGAAEFGERAGSDAVQKPDKNVIENIELGRTQPFSARKQELA